MKKIILVFTSLVVASVADAQNIPTGLTGLWRFQDSGNLGAATIGNSITFSNAPYGAQLLGPWTDIGVPAAPTVYSDGYVFQESSYNYLSVNPGFSANGGGSYVNQYTIAFDYVQTSGLDTWNSLYQTSYNGNASDGDLFTDGAGTGTAVHIGIGAVGYSTLTYDASTWHRIVLSVDNGSFFRVYVDGTLFLDGAGQGVDGRFSLYPDKVNLFADDNWEDQWGLVGTIMTFDHALTAEDIAAMGGWIDGASTPTPLIAPEPAAFSLAVLGALVFLLKRGRQ